MQFDTVELSSCYVLRTMMNGKQCLSVESDSSRRPHAALSSNSHAVRRCTSCAHVLVSPPQGGKVVSRTTVWTPSRRNTGWKLQHLRRRLRNCPAYLPWGQTVTLDKLILALSWGDDPRSEERSAEQHYLIIGSHYRWCRPWDIAATYPFHSSHCESRLNLTALRYSFRFETGFPRGKSPGPPTVVFAVEELSFHFRQRLLTWSWTSQPLRVYCWSGLLQRGPALLTMKANLHIAFVASPHVAGPRFDFGMWMNKSMSAVRTGRLGEYILCWCFSCLPPLKRVWWFPSKSTVAFCDGATGHPDA